MGFRLTGLLSVLAVIFLTVNCNGQETPQTDKLSCFNSKQIEWFFPGDFDKAFEKAEKENRLLLIKGLGFGLDQQGATCATKGCW